MFNLLWVADKRSKIFPIIVANSRSIRLLCILRIFRMHIDSFKVLSVYEQIHSANSQYTNRFIPRIR
jgi:hypothetical protein